MDELLVEFGRCSTFFCFAVLYQEMQAEVKMPSPECGSIIPFFAVVLCSRNFWHGI